MLSLVAASVLRRKFAAAIRFYTTSTRAYIALAFALRPAPPPA